MYIKQITLKSNKMASNFLDKASQAGNADGAYRNHPFLKQWFEMINVLAPSFSKNRLAHVNAYRLQREASAKRVKARNRLARCIFHFRRALAFRLEWDDQPDWFRSYFELSFEDNRFTASENGLRDMARLLINGDEQAEKAGFEPVKDPSRDLLQTCHDALGEAMAGFDVIKKNYAEISQTMAEQLREVQLLQSGLAHSFRLALDGKSESVVRNILRDYGIRFSYPGNSAEDSSDPPLDDGIEETEEDSAEGGFLTAEEGEELDLVASESGLESIQIPTEEPTGTAQ